METHIHIKYGTDFSNDAPYPIILEGKIWPTSKIYFIAMKYIVDNSNAIDSIRTESSYLSDSFLKELKIRIDWNEVKNEVIFNAIHAKITQHKKLLDMLNNSGIIVSHSLENIDGVDLGNIYESVKKYIRIPKYPIRRPREIFKNVDRDKKGKIIVSLL